VDVEHLQALAITKAWANVDLSKASLLATIAEGEKTIISVGQILFRFWRILRALKKFDVKALKKEITLKELADRYMEARYAIRPLVIDTKQILAAINAKEVCDRQTYRGFASDSDTTSVTNHVAVDQADRTVLATSSATRTVEVRAGVLTQIEVQSKLNTFGCDQILEMFWEITPFSFIVDWFLNVGTLIRAWTPEAGVKALTSWTVTKDVTSWITVGECVQNPDYNSSGYYRVQIDNLGFSDINMSVNRDNHPSRPWYPTFDVNLDPLKLLDLGIIMKKLMKIRR